MKPPPSHLQAVTKWEKEVGDHIPGLKVSNLPCWFVVPVTLDAGRKTARPIDVGWIPFVSVQDRWEDIPKVLCIVADEFQKGWTPPKGWKYATVAEHTALGEVPHNLDLPNPRYYTLKGWQVLTLPDEGFAARTLKTVFKNMLGVRWQHEPDVLPPNPLNRRRENIWELLDYHHNQGGNPQAFRDFIKEIARHPEELPPPPTANNILKKSLGGQEAQIRDGAGLSEILEEWLGSIRNRKAPAELKTLRARFPTDVQYDHFIALLIELEVLDEAGKYKPSKLGKGKMLGAYLGAASKLKMSCGNDRERVLVLNGAFEGLDISLARPQDLYGKPNYTKMFKAFKDSKWPS